MPHRHSDEDALTVVVLFSFSIFLSPSSFCNKKNM